MNTARADILGSQISVLNLPETLDAFHELISKSAKEYVCVSNVHTVVMGHKDPSYAAVTNSAVIATPDGMPLVWASKILRGPKIHGRASGPDIMRDLFQDQRFANTKHYFYGSMPDVLKKLESQLRALNPKIQIEGLFSPPFRGAPDLSVEFSAGERAEIEAINGSGADIVWVGLGAPKQELWMKKARPFLKPALLVGVGAAFDFLSGNKKRAPQWMQKSGLEWLHRFSQEPKRLAGRYLKTNPEFVRAVLAQALQEKSDFLQRK